MFVYMRRTVLAAVLAFAALCLTACSDTPEIDLPPLPTYSDEIPQAAQTVEVSASPVPTAAASAAPIAYNTPTPSPDPTPVPTVASDAPQISISDATLPEDMVRYNVATLHGTVAADKGGIIKVYACLLDDEGNTVQECSFQPYQGSFSLAGTVNAELQFALLEPGTYCYVLVAEAENNGIQSKEELINHSFTVFSSYEEMSAAAKTDDEHSTKISLESSMAGELWNFLVVYLDNPYGAAGIMGNIDVESQCVPQRVQGDFSTDYIFSQDYTQQVDSGLISKEAFVNTIAAEGYGSGYGLCQWSFERKEGLYDLAKERGSSVGDLETQCIYLVMELEMNYPELLKMLKTTDDARAAAREFFYVYEQGSMMGDRADLAEEYLAKYAA